MRTFHVAYDDFGRILSIVEEGGDVPVAGPAVNVADISVADEMEDLEVDDLAHRFHIDVKASRLMEGPIEDPRQNK
jgi:hypothetical protein